MITRKNLYSAAKPVHLLFLCHPFFLLHQLPWLTTTWSKTWNWKWRIFSVKSFLLLETNFAFSELWAPASNVFTMADWLGTITSVPELSPTSTKRLTVIVSLVTSWGCSYVQLPLLLRTTSTIMMTMMMTVFPRVPNPPGREGQHARIFRGRVQVTGVC